MMLYIATNLCFFKKKGNGTISSAFQLRFGKRLGGILVSVLALSAVGRGFDARPRQTKDIKIDICCFSA